MSITTLIVDDHTLFRDGLRRVLDHESDIEVVGEASDARTALELVRDFRPNVVLMDIGMPGLSSFEAARLIEKTSPATRLIFLTMYEDEEYLLQCLEVGAAGYVLKDAPATQLINAVREVSHGRKYLSPQVLDKLVGGAHPGIPGLARSSALTPREREVIK